MIIPVLTQNFFAQNDYVLYCTGLMIKHFDTKAVKLNSAVSTTLTVQLHWKRTLPALSGLDSRS